MIKLPDDCLAENLEGTCEPLAQFIADDESGTFDCCGRILQENRRKPDCKFRTCVGYSEGEKLKVMFMDVTERELIGSMTTMSNALYVIANLRENVEVKPFKKLDLAVDNGGNMLSKYKAIGEELGVDFED